MKNNMIGRFTISFYEGIYKDEVLLKTVTFHSNSERFRGNKIKEWAYEYVKEHPELLKEMEMANNTDSITNTESTATKVEKTEKEKQAEKLQSRLNIVTSKK